jgi:hypothetical protein
MEMEFSTESLVELQQATWDYIPEGSILHVLYWFSFLLYVIYYFSLKLKYSPQQNFRNKGH